MTLATSTPIDLKNFDESIKPSESFYKYVNGGWLQKSSIPSDRSSFNCFVELDELAKSNLKAIFDDSAKLAPGSSIVADLHLSGMNEAIIEKAGLDPIKDLISAISHIEKFEDVAKVVCMLHKEGLAAPLFHVVSSNDSRDSKNNALHGYQAGLGLPDRDYYFDDSKEKELDEYKKYISKLFLLSGIEKSSADKDANAVFEFEKALAMISLKLVDRRDPIKTYNKTLITDLQVKAPFLDWAIYFKELEISPSIIILENVEYFSKCSELTSSTSLSTLRSYLLFHLLNRVAPYLGKEFVDAHFEFNGKTLSGTKELQPRWKRVIGFVGDEVRDLVGKAYIEKYFPPSAKKAAKEMVDYIVEAFRHRINTVDWMQDATKEKALKKLDKFTVKIGYPDKWIDYSPIEGGAIKRDAPFLSNIRKASAFNTSRELKEYNRPADRDKWHMPPYMVNAYFNPPLNEIVFPAAILAEPFFFAPTAEYPLGQPAMSFGAIGGVISHEISHGYDDQGRKYDHEGNLVDWWLPEDGSNFEARAEKIIKQFDKFTVLGKNVNGRLTQGENIADLGGLSVSYAAFQEYMKAHGRDQLPQNGGFTQEQQFFISWSQVWRNLMRDETALQRLITDPHSPGEYRVDGPLMNLPEFHAAFGVKKGDRMFAPEEERLNKQMLNRISSGFLYSNIKISINHLQFFHTSSEVRFAVPPVDRIQERQKRLQDNGPEPNYENLVSGFSTSHHKEPFPLIHGGVLPEFTIAYESWGELNKEKDNAILLHTGLSASSHAKSHPLNTNPGWWETFIGPGLALDTNKYHVICTNVLGGCYGSTGPSSIDPLGVNGERYATRFPILTIFDMVKAQFKMLDKMGIKKLHASVGSSMGGMQSLAAAALFPDRVGKLVSISACARSNPYSMALRFSQRQVLMADPNWAKGFYYNGIPPHQGMKLARQIATITYRSGPEWEERFGRARRDPSATPSFCPDYLIENYLDYQGEKWCLTYDPNSLLYISKAMDMFDLSYPTPTPSSTYSQEQDIGLDPQKVRELLIKGMKEIQMPSLVLGVQTDVLFPSWQQKEIADCLKAAGNKHVKYYELDAKFGHDSFLLLNDEVGGAIKGHLELEF